MKLRLILIFGIIVNISIISQNLIFNPGFEEGIDYWYLWTEEPDSGIVDIVNNSIHSGDSALHFIHSGEWGWSFTNGDKNVSEGYILNYSVWIKTENLNGTCHIGVITMDSTNNIIDWNYSPVNIETSYDYTKYESRFIIPKNIVKISPFISGENKCNLYFDDVELSIIDTISKIEYCLENDTMKVIMNITDFSFQIYDKINYIQYITQPRNFLQIQSIDSLNGSYIFNCIYQPNNINLTIDVSLIQSSLKIQLLADSNALLSNIIEFPGAIASKEDDYLIIPVAAGMIEPVTKDPYISKFGGSYQMWGHSSSMSFVGVTNLKTGYMITSEDPWDTEINFKTYDLDFKTPHLLHNSSKGCFGYDRTFYYTLILNDGYNEMCDWYRNYAERNGYVKTIVEKAAENSNVHKLIGAVDFFPRELFYAIDDKFNFLSDLKNYGIDKAIISLSGIPGDFPEYPELIDTVNKYNYLSSRYDIYAEIWDTLPPDRDICTEGFPEDAVINKSEDFQKGWYYEFNEQKFYSYLACSKTYKEDALRCVSADLIDYHYNSRFIDVIMANRLEECYSPLHPLTRKEDANNKTDFMKFIKEHFQLVTCAERFREFAIPYLDYGEGSMSINPIDNDWSTPVEPTEDYLAFNMNPIKRLPLHSLVYHDSHITTWWTGDGVSKVPECWDTKDLFNVLYGTMPLFCPPYSNEAIFWYNNLDKFLTSYHLVSSVFRSVGYSQMIKHEMVSDDWKVQKTTFSNSWEVMANFKDTTFQYNDIFLSPKGFYASDGDNEVYRLRENDNTIAVAKLSDRLFINPYLNEFEMDGVRTSGTVFLEKKEDYIHLAFIGNQNFVDLNPSQFSWAYDSVDIFTLENRQKVEPEQLENGWIRLNKISDINFYRIEKDISNGNAISYQICQDESFQISDSVFTKPGNYSATLVNQYGGDSVVNLDLTVNPVYNIAQNEIICEGENITIGDSKFTVTGKYTVNLETINGCDSIVTLDLEVISINASVTQNDNILSADQKSASYQWLDCNDNYQYISGEQGNSFTPKTSGSYAVEVAQDACIDTSDCFMVKVSSIITYNDFGDALKVYPNPTEQSIIIDLGHVYKDVYLKIRSTEGLLVIHKFMGNVDKFNYELIEPKGVYIFQIETKEGKQAIFKIVKE